MNPARIMVLGMMVCALCKVQRVTDTKMAAAFDMYKLRWQVETMFWGMKSSGFDNEGSLVRDQSRMSNFIAIMMNAYVWCYLVGIYISENVKPITVLKHGRRAVSQFKYGLDYIFQCLVNHTNRYRIDVFKYLSYT